MDNKKEFQNFKIKKYTGIFTFIYFIFPLLQDNFSSSFSKRFEDYYFFFFSSSIYGFMQMFYTNSIIVYIIQLISWLISWGILIVFIRNTLWRRYF
jgi:hypothetical protein